MSDHLFTWPSVRSAGQLVRAPSLETIEREAREAARAEGLAEGRRQAEVELGRKLKELGALQQALERHRRELDSRQTEEIADFIRATFETLLGTVLRIAPEVFKDLLHNALAGLPADIEVEITAHPELAAALTDLLGRPIQADATLAPFSVHVSSRTVGWSADPLAEFRVLLEQGMTGGQ